jgi:carbon-monoxide dehydrogenase small subunit
MQVIVNGQSRDVDAPPMARLLDVLRLDLGLTGTKEGCGEGECGACTVLVDGLPVNSCLVAIGQCAGRSVETVEGLARAGELSGLQRSFVECGGAQCGICTPGMLVAAEALLRRVARPSEHEVREAIAGNLCRCTGYQRIVEAILRAAAARDEAPASKMPMTHELQQAVRLLQMSRLELIAEIRKELDENPVLGDEPGGKP